MQSMHISGGTQLARRKVQARPKLFVEASTGHRTQVPVGGLMAGEEVLIVSTSVEEAMMLIPCHNVGDSRVSAGLSWALSLCISRPRGIGALENPSTQTPNLNNGSQSAQASKMAESKRGSTRGSIECITGSSAGIGVATKFD
jgi:hypothetical protein